jgi:DNA-binding NarL/FixJ family response regulator
MAYTNEPTTVRIAIFGPTLMDCELLSRGIEASSANIKVVTSRVSSTFENDGELEHATVAVISFVLDKDLVGFKLLRRLAREYPNLNCVLLLDHDDHDLVIEAFRSGAVGVCERNKPCEDLCKCIVCVHNGQVWADSRQCRYILGVLVKGVPPFVVDRKGRILLTKREHEIAAMVAEGMKNREIATLLNLSESTVKNHLFHIYDHLGISNRAELILYLHGQRSCVRQALDSTRP